MRILLDTNQVVFATQEVERLTGKTRELLWSRTTEVFVSAVCWWEIALKSRILKPDGTPKLLLKTTPANMLGYLNRKGVAELAVEARHALALLTHPLPHNDPFDHLLLQQAQVESMLLLTSDKKMRDHPLAIYAGKGSAQEFQ